MGSLQLVHARPTDLRIPEVLCTDNRFRPAWLLSSYDARTWTVVGAGPNDISVIDFDIPIPGKKRLSSYKNLYETIKRIAYGVRTGPLAEVENTTVQKTIVDNLTLLASWMVINGIEHFSELTAGDRRDYSAVAAYGYHRIIDTKTVVEQHLAALLQQAAFNDDDDPDTRRSKAFRVFPTIGRQLYPTVDTAIRRSKILEDAGLAKAALSGRSCELISLFDEVEGLCGFRSSGKSRRQKNVIVDEDEEKPVTEEHLRRLLMSFHYLYAHRAYLDDAPNSDPFHLTSPRAEAKKIGKEVGRTATVPVTQAVHMIERSTRWVLDYAPALLDLKEKADEHVDSTSAKLSEKASVNLAYSPPKGPSSPFPIIPGKMKIGIDSYNERALCESMRDGMTLHSALIFLLTACSVVIAAFTARRASEIRSLTVDCIHYDDSGQPWLRCFIHKTMRTDTLIPIPELVVAAVKVLVRLSARARRITATTFLFQSNVPGSFETYGLTTSNFPNFNIGVNLSRFGYFIDTPLLADGTSWKFKPHQFRRFFAILYIWVFSDGNWGALQYHLRHFTSEMTRRYVSENEVGQIIAMANKEHTAEILHDAAVGLTKIGGVEGAKLQAVAHRLYMRYCKTVEVVSERKFKQRINRLIERTGISIAPFAWGYCVKRPTVEPRVCNCSKSAQPDFDAASVQTCTGCACNMVTPSAQGHLLQSIRFHKQVAESTDIPEMLRKASQVMHQKILKSYNEVV